MKKNALKAHMAAGHTAVNGWIAVPDSFQAEIFAAQGWDSVTIDMQHGACNLSHMVSLLQAVSLSSATPMVRVPWNEPSHIMRVLDAGAYGVICPMINTKAEAEAFVSAGRYPPMGARSNGPFRASHYAGKDYQLNANAEIQLFAMIETREAMNNLDAILSVKGLDGVYVGPTDLALSLGKPATLDPTDKDVLAAMVEIAKKTKAKGLIAGAHTNAATVAHKRYADGYHFCTIFNDVNLLAQAAASAVQETRGQSKAAGSSSY
jgi:4-hydroxy-2-oxoheptanedioate aldolase